ncbi:MAG: glycosyltransferase family 1 protein [Methanospirillum sp.]|nr:glycosyltransferase family 1 protein [Methanospirillum sp.]
MERYPDFPQIPERLSGLVDLAYNLWWSWHPEARLLFKQLSHPLWKECVHNPIRLMHHLPADVFDEAATDPDYLLRYDIVMHRFRRYMDERNGWFQEAYGEGGNGMRIAYFSAEFGLHHSLPFYAGGLGFLAGDHLKECSDLHVPVVGVGFMYADGYLHQRLTPDGWQEDIVETLDRAAAPITQVAGPDGKPLEVTVPLMDPDLLAYVWRVDVGRVPLYLLDTDHPANPPEYRSISSRLYTGDRELRLRQEIVLGVGGRRMLAALGVEFSAVHLNEGHPAFALLELLRERVEEGTPFDQAVREVRGTSIFTTHTPVPAGFDVFSDDLITKAFNSYPASLGLSTEEFLSLGRDPASPGSGFNMAMLALRLCGHANAVSERHGQVSRELFGGLWPGRPIDQVPVGSITNGVHLPTWLNSRMAALFDRHFFETSPNWLEEHDVSAIWKLVDAIPDGELWNLHIALKAKLLNRMRERRRRVFAGGNEDPGRFVAEGVMMDPSVLTIGFARRFSTYKRADLVFRDPERLRRILTHKKRPVQLIFAGKAHPSDEEGKRMLQRIYGFARRPEFEGRIAFLEDYGEQTAQYLVHGVDVWLNNPLPPMEASGTSGMKAAMNGVVNCSILDGWWLEGFNGVNGWAFGGEAQGGDRSNSDAEAIYRLLEEEITPLYYRKGLDGVPHDWVRLMKASIRCCAPRFSARRMVKEYVGHYYPHLLSCAASGFEVCPVDPPELSLAGREG